MAKVPVYEDKQVGFDIKYGGASRPIMDVASTYDRLQAKLQGDVRSLEREAQPIIREETIQKALKDVENGDINTESVARVAQETYRQTAHHAFLADVSLKNEQVINGIIEGQKKSGKFDVNAFKQSWDAYSRGTLESVKDNVIKNDVKDRLEKEGYRATSAINAMQQQQQRANMSKSLTDKFNSDRRKLMVAWGNSPEEAAQVEQELQGTLNTMLKAGLISKDKYEKYQFDIGRDNEIATYQVGFTEAQKLGQEKEFLNALKGAKSEYLTLDDRTILENKFKSGIAQREREQEAERRILEKQNDQKVKEDIHILKKGNIPEDIENTMRLPMSDENRKNLKEAIGDQVYASEYKSMTYDNIVDTVSKLNSKETLSYQEQRKLTVGENYLKDIQINAKKDPLTYAIKDGTLKEDQIGEITPFDFSDISKRDGAVEISTLKYGVKGKYLTENEENNIIDTLTNGTFEESLGVLYSINETGKERADAIYKQIGGKKAPTYAFAGKMISSGNVQGARIALQGKGANISLPSEFNTELQASIEGVFNTHTSDLYNEVKNGVTDYVKGLAIRGEEISVDDIDDYLELTIGKVTRINNKKTVLPYGTSKREFIEWLDNVSVEGQPELTQAIQDSTDTFGGNNLQYHYKGNGQYYIFNPDYPGPNKYVTSDDGTPIVLEWGK